MLSHSVLITLGLTQFDIDDLERDRSIHSLTNIRDLIMSLYLRITRSEKEVDNLWNKINFLKNQTAVMFSCGFTIGFLSGIYLISL